IPLRLGVLPRPEAVNDVLVMIDEDATARTTIRTDALLILQVPDPLLVEEILAAQGSDRTQIDHVAGQFIVTGFAGKDVDFRMVAAVDDLQLGGAADLAREADAARAHDTAVREQGDLVADVGLVGRLVLFVDHPALRPAVVVAEILQQALARLVADGTVERV